MQLHLIILILSLIALRLSCRSRLGLVPDPSHVAWAIIINALIITYLILYI
jgi:putative exporter of polyketide antibiotics